MMSDKQMDEIESAMRTAFKALPPAKQAEVFSRLAEKLLAQLGRTLGITIEAHAACINGGGLAERPAGEKLN